MLEYYLRISNKFLNLYRIPPRTGLLSLILQKNSNITSILKFPRHFYAKIYDICYFRRLFMTWTFYLKHTNMNFALILRTSVTNIRERWNIILIIAYEYLTMERFRDIFTFLQLDSMNSFWFFKDHSIVPYMPLGAWRNNPCLGTLWFHTLKDQSLYYDTLLWWSLGLYERNRIIVIHDCLILETEECLTVFLID